MADDVGIIWHCFRVKTSILRDLSSFYRLKVNRLSSQSKGKSSVYVYEDITLSPLTRWYCYTTPSVRQTSNDESFMDGDEFLDQLTRFQSKRMDDQRCSLSVGGGAGGSSSSGSTPDPVKDDLIDLIQGEAEWQLV